MAQPQPPPTLKTTGVTWYERLEAAWGAGQTPPWVDFLPGPEEKCDPERVFFLIQTDIEHRVQAGLQALLAEPYFQRASLDAGQQCELIRWEYQLRWKNGERVRLAEYLAAFPQHAEALRGLRPRWTCPNCRYAVVLGDETAETLACPACESTFSLAEVFGARAGGLARGLPSIPGYEIVEELGRGGMGVVYKARQTKLNRLVALKTIAAALRASPEALVRFRAEAEAVARLQHPNVVQIFEVGQQDDLAFFSLELVTGGTLAAQIAGRPQDPRRAAEVAETLARAVEHVHRHGIVHRDLKPANILLQSPSERGQKEANLLEGDGSCLTPDPSRAKITDFGLAKLLDNDSGRTGSGNILGTPSYMAPEQALGEKTVGPLADVYALGAILYELLTGRAPFQGGSALETMRLVLAAEPVPPRQLRPNLPRDLETICLKCLEKAPGKRYASALALADDLRRFLEGRPILARPSRPWNRAWKWARRHPTGATLLAVVVAGVVTASAAGWWFNASLSSLLGQVERESEERRRNLVRLQVETGNRHAESGDTLGALPWFAEALRLDGRDPARAWVHRARLQAILRSSPRLAHVWAHDGPVRHASFSPDGRHLATACGDGAARVWDLASGEIVLPLLRHEGYVAHVAYSPEGGRLVTASYDHTARVWDALTGKPLTEPLRHDFPLHEAVFSPDGKRVLTCGGSWKGNDRSGGVRLWDAATGQPIGAPLSRLTTFHVAFSPDGTRVVRSGLFGIAYVHDVATGKVLTQRPVLATGPRPDLIRYGEFSPDGRRVLLPFLGSPEVWDTESWKKLEPKATSAREVPSWPALHASFSPDGRFLATGGTDGAARVWGLGVNRALLAPFRHEQEVYRTIFSPDGRQLVTVSGDFSATVWHVPSGVRLAPALRHGGVIYHAAFSPDSRFLVTTGEEGAVRLWDLAAAWPAGRVLFDENIRDAVYDSTGRLAAASVRGGVKVWEARTGQEVVLLPVEAAGNNLAFSPLAPTPGEPLSGRLAMRSLRGEVCVWELPSGRRLAGPLAAGLSVLQLTFSPDGNRLLTRGNDFEPTKKAYSASISVWDVHTGKRAAGPFTFAGTARHAAFSPASDLIAVAGSDGFARVWDLESGAILHTFPHKDEVVHVAFSPKRDSPGRRLVTAANDRTVRVWDLGSGEAVIPPLWHGDDMLFAAFSPDGSSVVTGGLDRTARIWDATTGKPLTPSLPHAFEVRFAAFSPDGSLLLTLARQTVRVWEAATGTPLTPPRELSAGRVSAVSFTEDGQGVRLNMQNGAVATWDFSSQPGEGEDLAARALILSGRRVDATGDAVPLGPAELAEAFRRAGLGGLAAEESALAWHRHEAADGQGPFQVDWPGALWHLDRLAATAPERDVFLRRAAIRIRQGSWEKALGDYEMATRDGLAPRTWERAVGDFSEAMQYRRGDSGLYQGRALAHLSLGAVEPALADLAQAVAAAKNPDVKLLGRQARAQLIAGRLEEYRRTCGLLFGRLKEAGDEKAELIWVCCLAPGAVANPAALAELAQEMVGGRPADPLAHAALGAACHRVGRPAEARLHLEQAAKLAGPVGEPRFELFLVLVLKSLGDEKGIPPLSGRKGQEAASGGLALLVSRLDCQILRREVEGGKVP